MVFEQIRIGGDRNFAYLIGDASAGQAAAVDVGYNPQTIIDRLSELKLQLAYIISTHSDYDHTGQNRQLRKATGAKLAMHRSVSGVDVQLDDDDELAVGAVTMRIIACPGHSRDSIALLVDGSKLISGDELFVGKIGGTGGRAQAELQYESLHGKLMTLDDAVEVWPGHDFGTEPSSTIGRERTTNPFLLCEDFEKFHWLKNNWAAYKRDHGIA